MRDSLQCFFGDDPSDILQQYDADLAASYVAVESIVSVTTKKDISFSLLKSIARYISCTTLTCHHHEKNQMSSRRGGQKHQLHIHWLCLKRSNQLVYYILSLIVVALAVISIWYNNIVFTTFTAETLKCDESLLLGLTGQGTRSATHNPSL